MVYGFKDEMLGKRVWAYIPNSDGFEQRAGAIQGFVHKNEEDPMYIVQYDNYNFPVAALPEWLIEEPK